MRGIFMKVAIVDDDLTFMDALKMDLLAHFDSFDEDIKIDLYEDPTKLTDHYNIYFIDIDLVKYNGIAVASEIKSKDKNSIIVFVSAKQDLVFESFLARPFFFIRKINYEIDLMIFYKLIDKELRYDTVIPLSYKGVKTQIVISDIVYIENRGHQIIYHNIDNDTLCDGRSLKATLKMLPEELFVQVHQSYLANMSYINNYKGDIITMKNGVTVKIGVSYRKNFQENFHRYQLR